jgi:hypothetical protein
MLEYRWSMTHPRRWIQTAYTSEVQYNWWRRKIGRPGKEDRAMVNIPRIKTTKKNSFWVFDA